MQQQDKDRKRVIYFIVLGPLLRNMTFKLKYRNEWKPAKQRIRKRALKNLTITIQTI